MKNISLIILFSFFTSVSFAQEINTLYKNNDSPSFIVGGYGEPFVGGTQLNNDWGMMFGIKGGITFNRAFSFGPIAKFNIGLWEFQGNNLNYNNTANLELYMGSIGFFAEYIFKMEKKIHFSIPINIMVGGVSIREDTGFKDNNWYNEVESTGLFVVEPEMNIDFNVAKFFIPNLKIGYRTVFGSDLVNVTRRDLSGIYFGLGLKFGKF